jgi:anti-sigma factor RsiW
LSGEGTKYYSDLEVELLIDDITEIAVKAIEQAAAEAARAAALAGIDREAAALREAARWRLEAEMNLSAMRAAKQAGRKNMLLAALIGVFGGLAVGVTGTVIIGGR